MISLLTLWEGSQRTQLFVLQEMQTSSFVWCEAAFFCMLSYNLFYILQPKSRRKSNQNVSNIACSCLMSSLHSMPPPVMLQQGQQGSDVALPQFSHPKAETGYCHKSGHSHSFHWIHDYYICLQRRSPFLPSLYLYEPLYLTRTNEPFLEWGFSVKLYSPKFIVHGS